MARGADTNGLTVKFTSADGKISDTTVVPNLWLFVEQGKPASPFLPPGKFTAEFTGAVHAELRGTYYFKSEQLAGTLKLEINGNEVLSATGTGGPSAMTKAVQLNKGPNAIKAIFSSAPGDSFVRVGWTEKGTNVNPIPAAAVTHGLTPDLQNSERIYLGRELFLEHRCAKCHTGKIDGAIPELAMDAPTFEGIGLRRNADWLAEWILDPKAWRRQVHMPKILRGPGARQDAAAMAVYLASLKTEPQAPSAATTRAPAINPKAQSEIGKRSGPNAKATLGEPGEQPETTGERKPLFERLHCIGCHNAPGAAENDPTKLSLARVGEKFSEGRLKEFLKAPEQHFAWIRMPDFKLADAEAAELSDYLLKGGGKRKPSTIAADTAMAERGQKLVQTLGCLNCHAAGKVENQFTTVALSKLPATSTGCLAEKASDASKAPDFGFESAERDGLLAFLKTDRASLSRHAPIEFAARQMRILQCNACHGQIELVPPLEVLGGKLKPEWAAGFLAGTPFKVRADIHPKGPDWVVARMPAFASRARLLAEGMAQQQGYPPKSPDEGPIDEAAAKVGLKMTGKDNGLSCISCHAVNEMPALEVFDSEGVNLALSGGRLLKPYFFRWMRNPLAIDPQTKMPAFFTDEGKSPLTEYYDGDGELQINALYEYIRMGERMEKPSTGAQ